MPPSATATAGGQSASAASLTSLPPDILRTHILTRLDGTALASAACASAELNSLASHQDLWADICRSTWPSTDFPRLRRLISSFPDGPRSFFSASFPLLSVTEATGNTPIKVDLPSELISAVDIYYRNELIFSRVMETETGSGWFRCSPFRIDMLDPKDTCPTPIPHPETDDDRRAIADDLTLSWILIDPAGRRAVNLSSHKPVSVQRHWLNGEVHARFASVLAGEKGSAAELVRCGILVTCGGGVHGGGMQVREVSMQVEDMDGVFLIGRGSLGILHKSFEGRKGIKGRSEGEGKRKDELFMEMKRRRKERKLRIEGTLDVLCVAFGVVSFLSFAIFVLFR